MEDPSDDIQNTARPTKRRSSAISPLKSPFLAETTVLTVTPSRRRAAKKVRFSAPVHLPTSNDSTGLTPAVHQASLSTPRQRLSTPYSNSNWISDHEVQFTPFRQVLDERCKRRIRRNGLSSEMNEYDSERKSNVHLQKQIADKNEELGRLRALLAEQNVTKGMRDAEVVTSSQRVDEVEAELDALRQSFNLDQEEGNDAFWDFVDKGQTNAGPPSDSGGSIRIYEDEADANCAASNEASEDAEILAMALDLEAAKREKRQLFKDVRSHVFQSDFNFADSPARMQTSSSSLEALPSPPKDFLLNLSKTLKATTSRAEDAELALHALEVELKALGFARADSANLVGEIASHFRNARLELERMMPGETVSGLENANVLPEMLMKLKTLHQMVQEREAELKTMRDQQRSMKGNFDHAIYAAEKANARAKELEDAIETGAEEMLHIRMKAQKVEKENAEKDKNIASLISALDKYRDDVSGLEQIVLRLESEQSFKIQEAKDTTESSLKDTITHLEAKVEAETLGRQKAEESAVERLQKMRELENALAITQKHLADLKLQITALDVAKSQAETFTESQIGSLNTRISSLSTALASANAEVSKLRAIKSRLEARIQAEVGQAQQAVDTMHSDFIRSVVKASEARKSYIRGSRVRLANGELEDERDMGEDDTPMTPASLVRFVDVEAQEEHVMGSVQTVRGKGRLSGQKFKRRRRNDSGIGMGSLSEEDEDMYSGSSSTAELSSEADIAVDE